ncbi:MAG: zinc-binding dehydrogenase [Victivallales bacterium]|nr:zinc-binding dehydrogenase [Victivallales bacterium]
MSGKEIKGRAIVFPCPGKAEVHGGVAMPVVDDDSVVIKTKYSGISRGTEMDHYHARFHCEGQFYPLITGYEPAGEVIYAGPNVTHLKKGDRAVVSNLFAGFDERYCVAWGGQTEYVVVNKTSAPDMGTHPDFGALRASKIPDNVSYQEACLSVLGAVAYHGIERIGVKSDDTVMIVGQGCVGMMAAQIAASLGAKVMVSDLYEYRLSISRKVGITDTINATTTNQVKEVLERTDGKGADVVIDCTGTVKTYKFIWDMVKDHGTVHAQGMVLEPMLLRIQATLFAKSLRFSSTCGEHPRHQREALKMISNGRINAKAMISTEMSFLEASAAYDLVDRKPDECLKLIFKWE